jgi:DNA-binding beta-propeller fold protein YncE
MRLDFTASPEVRQVLDAMRRTEDVSFSPSGRRLAIAEFGSDRIVLLDVEITASRPSPSVELTDWMAITSPSFREPHGVSFLDEETLVVANRAGGVSLAKVPPAGTAYGLRTVAAPALETLHRSRWFHSPGSLAIASVDGNCHEVLVCNNYADYVSRHRVDANGLVVTRNEMLLAKGLAVPDGIAVNPDNRWIAVSSHRGHHVLLYRNGPELNPQSEADGVLRGVECPHGVRFTQDDNFVLVADAARRSCTCMRRMAIRGRANAIPSRRAG